MFCDECINENVHRQVNEQRDDELFTACPNCDRVFSKLVPYSLSNEASTDEDDEDMSQTSPFHPSLPQFPQLSQFKAGGHGRARGHKDRSKPQKEIDPNSLGLDMLGFESKSKDSTWISKSDTDRKLPLTPSAKLTVLKRTLLKGFQDGPLDKVRFQCPNYFKTLRESIM